MPEREETDAFGVCQVEKADTDLVVLSVYSRPRLHFSSKENLSAYFDMICFA